MSRRRDTRLGSRGTSDEGSVLIMALAFLSLFGLAVGALLTFADSAFRNGNQLHTKTEQQYAADAAVEGAINTIRGDVTIGKEGPATGCFSLPAAVNGTAVSVECRGRPGSGAGSVVVGGGSLPANSVLTLPSHPSEGLVLSAGAAPLVTGNVITNRTATVPATASLTVQGSLTCRTLSGTGPVSASTTSCPAAVPPSATDPGYSAPISSVPAPATAPACAAGGTVTFAPGFYKSAAALNALTGGGCPNKRFHFTPGVYYFQFDDLLPSGTRQWLINDSTAEVVGGAVTTAAFPSRCNLALAGVQFIFGADSRLAVTAGSFELCPPLSAGQRIAVYAPTASAADIVGPVTPLTSTVETSTPVGSEPNTFTPAGDARQIDATEAKFTASTNKGVAVINLAGFSTTAIPANARITSASLRVAARYENEWLPSSAPTLTLTPADGSAAVAYPAIPCAMSACPVGTTVAINVLDQINTPARANGISMQYRVTDKQGVPYFVSYFNGAALDIGYTIDGIKATSPTGCMAATPYLPSTNTTCAVLRGTGAAARMAIKGTIYAPLAAVDLSMTGQLNQVTQRGVVARTLQLGLTRGAGYAGALIAMPGTANRQVLLTASIGGDERLRADVTIDDGLGSNPGASVTVNRWSVLR
jgi:hypothetical protein